MFGIMRISMEFGLEILNGIIFAHNYNELFLKLIKKFPSNGIKFAYIDVVEIYNEKGIFDLTHQKT